MSGSAVLPCVLKGSVTDFYEEGGGSMHQVTERLPL
ncbi:hypothetical protein HEMA109418_02845 [Helcobacillus massiliensis]|uniref:Uncharacterized protein n=1 Tax=Helcobacillus massiliensis TaxID=521392 RepID=A0A839QP16_9MICO|nr:hypothetical protein [Helcobacillus massiliensis]